MADYIYLLDNRLSAAQKMALGAVRDLAKAKGLTLFLVGGAVRDLTSGSPVRDLDVVVQGNALKLKKELELAGAVVAGTVEAAQTVFVRFPGGVRMEIGSTMSVTYPKPGKPVMKASTILDDLRRRDFTANAMALSLNEGSYGLLMDPLNGVADIENRELRLVSNYGFIEDPVRMIRAVRFAARLGWALEEKTKARYETGKEEGYISALDEYRRGYEAEEIVHEEDPLRVMRRLEAEGWMQVLAPGWTVAKANVTEMDKLRESLTQLQMQGIHPDAAAVHFPLLTAKMGVKEVAALKKSFPRQGFVAEIDGLEGEAKEFATALGGRAAAAPSAAYRMIVGAKPEALLYVSYTTKSGALQAKLKSFLGEWSQARQKIPYSLMQEMRITPEVAGYSELVEKLFFELMDGKLGTTEEMKAYLEPYSPPAPPPPVNVRRARASKKDAKGKGKGKKAEPEEDEDGELLDDDPDSDEADAPRGSEEDEAAEDAAEDFNAVAELGGGSRQDDDDEEDEDEDEEEAAPAAARKAPAVAKKQVAVKANDPEPKVVAPENAISAKPPASAVAVKSAGPAKVAAKAAVAVKAVSAKTVAAKAGVGAKVVAKAGVAESKLAAGSKPGIAVKGGAVAAGAAKGKVVAAPAKGAKVAAKQAPVKRGR